MIQIKYFRTTFFLIFLSLYGAAGPGNSYAAAGDTTVVHGFQNYLHQNCNSGTGTFAFPADTLNSYKVMLRYELSCPSFGCDIYDRIATLKLLRHTGTYDSTLTIAPNFIVDGNRLDSIWFMRDTSYQYSYNTQTSSVDSVAFPSMQIVFYSDSLNPLSPTDTLTAWPSYYNQYVFDANGIATDSVLVQPDSMVYYLPDSVYSAPYEVIEPIEIARAITPYGQGVVLLYDVSDYKPLLKDSVTLYTYVCGYSNGWQVTTDFYFIEGTPPIHPYKITNLWNGTFPYGNTGNPIENHLQPISLSIDTQAVYSKIRLVTTGHGFGGYPNQNVAEFYDVTHHLVAGTDTLSQHLWRADCGINPLYPQGAPGYSSTWFYQRANWCPGSYVTPHDYNVSSLAQPGNTLVVDYNMQPYTVTGGPSGWYPPEYYIQSQAIFYDQVNYVNNAAILEIRKPNGAFEYNRLNPVCDGTNPQILIKNYGTNPLTSLTIQYGIDGSTPNSLQWTGSLEFLDTISIDLPGITYGAGNHTFTAYLENPNQSPDEFVYDDTLITDFIATNIINANGLWIQLKNDGSPNEASWDIRDANNNVVFSRPAFPGAYAITNDTVYLANGCYTVSVYDSYGDGLCCYGGGQGFFSINKIDGNVLYYVKDFGASFTKSITLDNTLSIPENKRIDNFFIYPNPARDNIWLNTSIESGDASVEIHDISGRLIYLNEKLLITDHRLDINTSNFQSGVYFIRLSAGGSSVTKKLIIN